MNNFNKKIETPNKLSDKAYFGATINIFLLLFIFALVFLLAYSLFIFSKARKVYFKVESGQKNIEESLSLFKKGDFSSATLSAKKANDDFSYVLLELDKLSKSFVFEKIYFLNENINDFKYLARTAEILSKSAEKTFFIAEEVEDIISGKKFDNFLEFSEYEKYRILKLLYENSPEINGIKANIDLSLLYLQKSESNKFLEKYDDQRTKLKEYLETSSVFLSNLRSFSAIIPTLTGYPDSAHYLIILQNNNELRPTGGFIGSYGIMEIKLGDIVNLQTNDVYHLDMPASLDKNFNIAPPEAIKKYLGVNRWFMRDSNWSPDFPSSAKNIKWFYEQEMISSGRKNEIVNFDGVIAITPRLITDLLYISGPVEVNGKKYDKDNFTELLQYEVEMAFREDGISEWDRKNVIGDIVKEIKIKLFNLPSEKWPELFNVFNQNISRKNILVYLFDNYKRELAKTFFWDGEIKDSKSDFVMAIDANLAAFKTDRVMEKKIVYDLKENEAGIFSKLSIYYKNNGWFDWQTTRYRTYTRVYVPLNSSFIKSSGISSGEAYYSIDKEINNPKTFFGAFISVEPGQERVLSFEYKLADEVKKVIKEDNYYLLKIQKQPGNEIKEFRANFEFERDIISFEGEGSVEIKNKKELVWSNQLDKDYELTVFFDKKND